MPTVVSCFASIGSFALKEPLVFRAQTDLEPRDFMTGTRASRPLPTKQASRLFCPSVRTDKLLFYKPMSLFLLNVKLLPFLVLSFLVSPQTSFSTTPPFLPQSAPCRASSPPLRKRTRPGQTNASVARCSKRDSLSHPKSNIFRANINFFRSSCEGKHDPD